MMRHGFGRAFIPLGFIQQPAYDTYNDDLGQYSNEDEIMNSSPCPPERGNRQYTQYSTQLQPQCFQDPIEDFTDNGTYEEERFSDPRYDYQPGQELQYDPLQQQYEVEDQKHDAYSQQELLQTTYSSSQQQPQAQYIHQQREQHYALDPIVEASQEQFSAPTEQREVLTKAKRIHLRPVSELPDMYRAMFKFGVFNAVQSSCFDTILHSNENLVASAPTGSGKTVLFELAIIQMLTRTNSASQNTMKCVYMAPTKALCSERYRDWSAKFGALGIKCCELTGDTVHFGKGVWGDAKNSTIIVTTAEKWDSLTRNWDDHGKVLSSILLFLVDEVHILNESRGSTLEVVISRMKLRGSGVRFVLVSATAPNIQDIASWIGSTQKGTESGKVFEFGEDFRPCKLKKIVVGIPRQKGHNDFQFAKNLDYKLFPTLQIHSVGKPILVFCSTRKGVYTTAEQLIRDYQDAEKKRQSLPWARSARIEHSFNDKRLTEFSSYGIGVHHAGMSLDDRRAVEDLFLRRSLRVLVSTSTLAVGVNLPAHTVVIKGVHTFQNGVSVEYSDLDVMQMLGRAGRPQFDTDGTAIIICELDLEAKYRALVQGTTILESSLHVNLSEHLNSEIGLGTITSIGTATDWLRSSFLFQRIRKNPSHYALGKEEYQTWEERMDDLVLQSIDKLKASELITCEGKGHGARLRSTEYGDIMSKFYIRQATMAAILALPEKPTLRDILEMIASSEELTESKIRASEKTYLNKLKRHDEIRFGVKKVDKTADKVFLLIQAVLGGISLNSPEYKTGDSQPQLDAFGIFKHVPRISRAVVEVAICRKRGAQLKHGFEALRCLTAKAWEDRHTVLRQIETIGEKSLKVLAENGITSLAILRKQEAHNLELLLNRRTPFGFEMLAAVREFPHYTLRVTQTEVRTSGGQKPVEIDLSIECGLSDDTINSDRSKKKIKGRSSNMTAIITMTSDMELIDFRRTSTKALFEKKSFELTATLVKPSQSIDIYISSESVAGLTVSKSFRPEVSSSEYPTRNTRPPNAVKAEMDDFQEDPNFWANMALEDYDLDGEPSARDCGGKASLPIRTEAKATKANHTEQPQQQQKRTIEIAAQRFSNGNYACNHACKDKQKCRHLCCREGLPHPPKKSMMAQQPESRSQAHSKPADVIRSDMTRQPPRDHMIEHLEALHRSTNVQDNLKLATGQRIKVVPNDLKRKRKEFRKIDTNIKFTDLMDVDKRPLSPTTAMAEAENDDLPEAHEILNNSTSGALKTIAPTPARHSDDLFDSDMDAHLRDFPDIDGILSSQTLSLRDKALFGPSPSSPPTKRTRFCDSEPRQYAYAKTSLFLSTRSDDEDIIVTEDDLEVACGAVPPGARDNEEDDDFALDPSCIDIIPSTPDLVSTSAHSDDDTSLLIDDATIAPTTFIRSTDVPKAVDDVDDFAEFEAWLNSGAVEIVN